MKALSDELMQSGPWARRVALASCRNRRESAEDCSLVHGHWQLLRLLGLAGSNEVHAGFFSDALVEVAASPAPRILACGGADYFMAALILQGFRRRGIEPSITAVDRCETPLALYRWYAERHACRIQTIRCDVLHLHDDAGFDAVCAHAFLGYFHPSERPALLAAWRRVLRPGGRVITVAVLREPSAPERLAFSEAEVLSYRGAAIQAAQSLGAAFCDAFGMQPLEMGEVAAAYARAHGTWTLRSEDELRSQIEAAGLEIERFVRHTRMPSDARGVTGPSAPGPGVHLRIVARRP